MTPDSWRRIDELFAAALERDPAVRSAWLDEQCVGEQELRRELERLLKADPGALDAVSGAVGDSVRSFHATPAGQHIGPYEILSEIGRGGMGVVYLAQRDDVFRKQVAVKVVKRGMDTDQIVSRFRHERRILARLEHPNIARIIDGGSSGDGLPYLVMEYVQGLPITEYCRRQNLGLEAMLELFRKVCEAVGYAHQNLVVHRDLKPSNILVDKSGAPRLLDFGIAKLLDADTGEDATPLTSEAMRLLTPRYASPEQVMGELVTTASDIYSLGAVLYELLTAEPAHRITGHTPAALTRAICEAEIVTPSVAARSGDGRIPAQKISGDLDSILLTALRKEPRLRYASVQQFSEDLQRSLENRPIRARPRTLRYRAAKFVRRNIAATIAALIAVALLIGGATFSTYQARRAERRFFQLRRLANAFLFDIHDQLETIPGTTPVREAMVHTVLEYLDALARESGSDPTLLWELATAYQRVGDLQGFSVRPNLGHPQAALESHSKALHIAQQLAADDFSRRNRLLLVAGYHRVGYLLRSLGQTAVARDHLQKGLELAEALAAARPGEQEESQWLLRTHGTLADLERSAGNVAASAEHNLRGLEAVRRWNARHPTDLSRSYVASGLWRASQASQDTGDLNGAVRYAREDITIREEQAAHDPGNRGYQRDLMNSYEQLASVLSHRDHLSLDDRAAARPYYEKVLAIAQQLANADPSNVMTRSDLVIARRNACEVTAEDDPRAAAEHCGQAIELLAPMQAVGDIYQGRILAASGRAHRKLGHHQVAGEFLRRALEFQEQTAARDPLNSEVRLTLLRTHSQMGLLLEDMGDRESALASHQRALAIADEVLPRQPLDPLIRQDLTNCYEALGHYYERRDWQQARQWYQKSLNIWVAWPRSTPSTRLDQGRRERAAQSVARCDAALVRHH